MAARRDKGRVDSEQQERGSLTAVLTPVFVDRHLLSSDFLLRFLLVTAEGCVLSSAGFFMIAEVEQPYKMKIDGAASPS
jgi:hypothetical protein